MGNAFHEPLENLVDLKNEILLVTIFITARYQHFP